MAAIQRRPWFPKQVPVGTLTRNERHPLAPSLAAFYAPGASLADISGNGNPVLSTVGAGNIFGSSGRGASVYSNGTNGQLSGNGNTPSLQTQSQTVFWFGRMLANPTGDWLIYGTRVAGGGSPYFRTGLYYEAATNTVSAISSGSGSFDAKTTTLTPSGLADYSLITITFVSGQALVYLNGVLRDTLATPTGTMAFSSGDGVVIGDNRANAGVETLAAGQFSRVLTADEVALFSADPFAMVRPAAFTLRAQAATAGAALAATPVGVSTATTALTTAIPLAAAPAGLSTTAAALTTSIPLSATTAGLSTSTSALTTAIALAATPAGLSTATTSLTTSIALAATPAGLSTTAAALTTSIPLAVAAAGVSTTTATMAGTGVALAVAAAGVSTSTIALTTGIALNAAPAGVSTTTLALSTGIALVASPAGVSTATTALTTSIALASAASGISTAAAALTTGIALSASPVGLSTTTPALTTQLRLVAALFASSTITVSLTTAVVAPSVFPPGRSAWLGLDQRSASIRMDRRMTGIMQ